MSHHLPGRIEVLGTAMLAVSSGMLGLLPGAAAAQGGSVHISIAIDEESAELIRAWRRRNGLDPPDLEADLRVAALLQRRAAAARAAGEAPPPTDYVSRRRKP